MPAFGIPPVAPDPKLVEQYCNETIPVVQEIVNLILAPLTSSVSDMEDNTYPVVNMLTQPAANIQRNGTRWLDKVLRTIAQDLVQIVEVNRQLLTEVQIVTQQHAEYAPPNYGDGTPSDASGFEGGADIVPETEDTAAPPINPVTGLPMLTIPPPAQGVLPPANVPLRQSCDINVNVTVNGQQCTQTESSAPDGTNFAAEIPAIPGVGSDTASAASGSDSAALGLSPAHGAALGPLGALSEAAIAAASVGIKVPGVSGPSPAVAAAEQAQRFAPPKLQTTLPCPQAPPELAAFGAPIGTKEWCDGANQVFDWLEELATLFDGFLNSVVKPQAWLDAVHQLQPRDGDNSILAQVQRFFVTALEYAVKFAGDAILTIKDAIKCAWYYARVLTPMKRPTAYYSLIVLKNIIRIVGDSRIGSQSYLGFTIGLSITLPHAERYVDRLMEYLVTMEVPTGNDAMEAYLSGRIDRTQYECILRLNGQNPETFEPFLLARSERLQADPAIEYARRQGKDKAAQLEALRKTGAIDPRQAEGILALYDELPSITDHLHWLQRNVFDDEYVEKYQLLDGFEERFWKKFGGDLYAQGYTKERASLEYAAHWVMPNPTQMREFVYRLRPGRDASRLAAERAVTGISARDVTGKPASPATFTVEDYQAILAEQDYSSRAREWFAATVHPVPALSYLRDMHRAGLLTDAQMAAYHADLGYTETDSELFTQVDAIRKNRMRATQGHGWDPSAIAKAYAGRTLSPEAVTARMLALSYTAEEAIALMERADSDIRYAITVRSRSRLQATAIKVVTDSLKYGVMTDEQATTALVNVGWGSQQAKGVVALQGAANTTQRIAAIVRHLKRAYLNGEIDASFTRERLNAIGIVSAVVDQNLAAWQLEQTPQRKRRTAKQTMTDLVEGQLTSGDAILRWKNLGYNEEDINLWLADAERATFTTPDGLDARRLIRNARVPTETDIEGYRLGIPKRMIKDKNSELSEETPPAPTPAPGPQNGAAPG